MLAQSWSYGVVVSTLDFESSDLGSNPSRTFAKPATFCPASLLSLLFLPPVVLFCLPRRLPRSHGVVVIALDLKIITFLPASKLECLTLVYYVALAGSTLSP